MTRLLSLALLAATLSAQTPESTKHWLDRIKPIMLCAGHCDVTGYSDGNGALEAFYKPHHSKTSWIRTGIRKSFRVVAGQGALRNAGISRLVGSPVRSTPDIQADEVSVGIPVRTVWIHGVEIPALPKTSQKRAQ